MYILPIFLALLILNLSIGIYFVSEWDKEKKRSNPPAVLWVMLASLMCIIVYLSFSTILKLIADLSKSKPKESLVYLYLIIMLIVTIMTIFDWDKQKDKSFSESWKAIAIFIIPLVMVILVIAMFTYAIKQDRKELIFS